VQEKKVVQVEEKESGQGDCPPRARDVKYAEE